MCIYTNMKKTKLKENFIFVKNDRKILQFGNGRNGFYKYFKFQQTMHLLTIKYTEKNLPNLVFDEIYTMY